MQHPSAAVLPSKDLWECTEKKFNYIHTLHIKSKFGRHPHQYRRVVHTLGIQIDHTMQNSVFLISTRSKFGLTSKFCSRSRSGRRPPSARTQDVPQPPSSRRLRCTGASTATAGSPRLLHPHHHWIVMFRSENIIHYSHVFLK